jgi:ApaG protein
MHDQYLVDISAEVVYSPAHSTQDRLVYVYFITMQNRGRQSAQLLRRHFFIRDAHGFEQEIEGEGVGGEQPIIAAGQTYRYHSIVPIQNPPGSMRGYYTFIAADGAIFQAELPLFMLYEPPGFIPQNLPSLEPSKRILN